MKYYRYEVNVKLNNSVKDIFEANEYLLDLGFYGKFSDLKNLLHHIHCNKKHNKDQRWKDFEASIYNYYWMMKDKSTLSIVLCIIINKLTKDEEDLLFQEIQGDITDGKGEGFEQQSQLFEKPLKNNLYRKGYKLELVNEEGID